MESVAPVLASPGKNKVARDSTVVMSPNVGGGVGRFVDYSENGNALVDIKGVVKEFAEDEFSAPERSLETGNDWFHMSIDQDTPGLQKDKPEFRPGDMVKIADVYGTVIGPGFGVFIGYGTTGEDCIILFDGKQIVVPVENVAAVLEQDAKDNFDQTDNDGNLSPMSFGSDNVKIEQEPSMDRKDEFSKWMSAVEEALTSEDMMQENPAVTGNGCGCQQWDCTVCFPQDSMGQEVEMGAMDAQGEVCPHCGQPHGEEIAHDDFMATDEFSPDDEFTFGGEDDDFSLVGEGDDELEEVEQENSFEQMPRSKDGRGVKLGDIVQKTEYRKVGQDSPMTNGGDNLDEEIPDGANPDDYGKAGRYAQDSFGNLDEDLGEKSELVNSIIAIQNMGFSNSNTMYDETDLEPLPMQSLLNIKKEVMGGVTEADAPKPVKKKTVDPDFDFGDILNPRDDELPATIGGSDDDFNRPADDADPMQLPAANPADTRRRTQNITPSDTMRDYMSRINPLAGAGEPDLEPEQDNQLVARTAQDVPAVISRAMRVSGEESPDWHRIRDLPGFGNRNIRGMGRQVFGMFTRTPVEQIQTIANVNGQGPNTGAEVRAVAAWLLNNAEDMGDVELNHGDAIPGYAPDVKEFRINGVRFHVVRDPMGEYIYAYPDKDSVTSSPMQQRLGRDNPRLREGKNMLFQLSILEQIDLDEKIKSLLESLDEEIIDESTLSKMLGKQKGGQNLVKWLHRRDRLSNEADLTPVPFTERIMWKQFKSNPDNFVIVSATNGVAGIKPSLEYIQRKQKEARASNKVYSPSGDYNLPYHIIAFTDDGQQVDPALFRQGMEKDPELTDPTVTRQRMGLVGKKDKQNPYNTFEVLEGKIGRIRTVWISGFENVKDGPAGTGSIERDKMSKRASYKATPKGDDAINAVYDKMKPVLTKLFNEIKGLSKKRAQKFNDADNYEGAKKASSVAEKMSKLLAFMNSDKPIKLRSKPDWNSPDYLMSTQFVNSLVKAAGAPVGSPQFDAFIDDVLAGNFIRLKPVVDSMRTVLTSA